MKKKVLHVAETIKGGVASVLNQLVDNNESFENICIIPDSQVTEIECTSGVKIIEFKRTGRDIKSFVNLFTVFAKAVKDNNPDIIHLHSSFAGLICRLALFILPLKNNAKIIYCPHAFSFLMDVSYTKKKIYALTERFLCWKTDAIICTSEYEKNIAILYGVNKLKLQVIYNGIKEPIPITDTEQNPYDSQKINILFVGRFDYQKGVDILFQIIRAVGPKFHFTLVGDSVHCDFKKTDISSVTYIGWITSTELALYYRYADVTLMPSRWESFGLVAAESNSYGTPVLASDTSSLPEVIVNNKTGYLFNIENIAEALSILNEKTIQDWAALKNDCYLNYQEKFRSTEMIRKVEELYHNIAY